MCLSLLSSVVVKEFQEYTEPEEATQGSPQRRAPAGGAEDEEVVLPLGENVLTHNLGIPVLIICTKVSSNSTATPLKTHTRSLALSHTHGFSLLTVSLCMFMRAPWPLAPHALYPHPVDSVWKCVLSGEILTARVTAASGVREGLRGGGEKDETQDPLKCVCLGFCSCAALMSCSSLSLSVTQ